MPRLPPSLLRQAKRRCPNLASLIPACRDIQSATNELRWLAEFARETTPQGHVHAQQQLLKRLCRKRGRGVPLQYILGSQPFGLLDIKCRPGVLIPRPETEAYTLHLIDIIKLLKSNKGATEDDSTDRQMTILDFCTGTGCIPLLVFASLQETFQHLTVRGVDIAPVAVELAQRNIEHNINSGRKASVRPGQTLKISRGDIFNDADIDRLSPTKRCDVLISNPPYISRDVWHFGRGQLGYSVRKYEPRLALVPDVSIAPPAGWQHGDVFYLRLLDISMTLKPSIALFELGGEEQIRRVLAGLFRHRIAAVTEVEVWRDWPDGEADADQDTQLTLSLGTHDQTVSVKGSGHMRCIFMRNCWHRNKT
ncbi:hypothetical protein E4U43_000446 [Claviceps pusilla]|uniref:DNA methylase adenine-specific domain-containing protein n=1 Tax=Claviceps pusilla TaxID=123648 RepID=A0A9P7SWQ5_9HYPO|nr:hypothetical protein E4U43_000446 [Claviceps pusilla]